MLAKKQWRRHAENIAFGVEPDKIDMKNGDSIIDLSQIVFHDGEKEEAFDLFALREAQSKRARALLLKRMSNQTLEGSPAHLWQ